MTNATRAVEWTPPYPAPAGWLWREQSGRHYLAHERAWIGKGTWIGEGARIGKDAEIGEHASGLATGMLLGYRWAAYRTDTGVLHLSYGCELLTVADWRERLADLCRRHKPHRADLYERAIGALLDVVETLVDATMPVGED